MPREQWDLRDAEGNLTGQRCFRGEVIPPGQYHLVVDVWFLSSRNEVLVQKRAAQKENGPGLWCCTGGAVVCGEDSAQAMRREVREELGFEPDMRRAGIAFRHRGVCSLKDVWLVRQDVPLRAMVLQTEEVAEARWVTLAGLAALMREKDAFYPLGYLEDILAVLKRAMET